MSDTARPDGVSADVNPFYTPLLPYLLSMCAAFLAAGEFPLLRAFSTDFFVCASAFVLASVSLRILFCCGLNDGGRFLRRCSTFAWFAGFSLMCVTYFDLRVESVPASDFAPREVAVSARIDEIAKGANGSLHGLATILSAPDFASDTVGRKMWFTVSDNRNAHCESPDFKISQTVKFRGILTCSSPSQRLSRGKSFFKSDSEAFGKYLKSRFVFLQMNCRASDVKSADRPVVAQSLYAVVRDYMDSSLSSFAFGIGGVAGDSYRAMLLGDRSLLPSELKKRFAETGTMHVFAISGLHVGFAAAVLYFALGAVGLNWKFRPFVALPTLWLYVAACGSKPSAIRAFAMVALFWIALAFGRGIRPFGALVLAAVATLLISPDEIFDAGFGMSYGIVASLFVYGLPLYTLADSFFGRRFLSGDGLAVSSVRYVWVYLAGGLCISIGAMFASAPMGTHWFGYFSPMSVVYSPFFVSAAGIAVMLGFVGFALPACVAGVLNSAAACVVAVMIAAADGGSDASDCIASIKVDSACAAYGALFLFLAIAATWRKSAIRFLLAPTVLFSTIILFSEK